MNRDQARILCERLMDQHGLKGWSFGWMRSKNTLGMCFYRTKTIKLSYEFVDVQEYDEILDTILHEIAHALSGHTAGHGYEWKRKFIDIGGSGRVRSDPKTASPDSKYVGRCPQGHEFKRNAKSDSMMNEQRHCIKCRKVNAFDLAYARIMWFERASGIRVSTNPFEKKAPAPVQRITVAAKHVKPATTRIEEYERGSSVINWD